MKNRELTIEFMQKRIEEVGNRELINLFERYFADKKVGDPTRPSQEVSLWFVEQMSEIHGYTREFNNLLELEYITFEQLIKMGQAKILVAYFRTFSTFFSVDNCSIPTTPEKMKELFSLIPQSMREPFARNILTLNIQINCCTKREQIIKRNFFATIEGCFTTLLEYILVRDHGIWMWRNASYIPTRVIKEAFNRSVAFTYQLEEVRQRFKEHSDRFYASIEQTLELLPFFAALPQAGMDFPFSRKSGAETLLRNIEQSVEDLIYCSPKERLLIYNVFIKPLQQDLNLFTRLYEGRALKEAISGLARIAAAVVPPSELLSFVRDVINPICGSKINHLTVLEHIASVLSRANKPVTKEFILYQFQSGVRSTQVCLNNECINDLNFWKESHEYGTGEFLFQRGLQHNTSFSKWFKLNVADIEFYKENKGSISWFAFGSLPLIPKEFIMEFRDYLSINTFSREALEKLDEESILFYLQDDYFGSIPALLLEVNHCMDEAFVAKHAIKLLLYRNAFSRCNHLKLKDIVLALV